MKQEALLTHWRFEGRTAVGSVYGHPRLADGKRVRTTQIIGFNKKTGVIETLNTFYKLGGWTHESEESNESRELERRLGESLPDVPKNAGPLHE